MEPFDQHLFHYFNDDQFMEWVATGADPDAPFWQKILENEPEKTQDLLQAKQIALDLLTAQSTGTGEIAEDIWRKVLSGIERPELASRTRHHRLRPARLAVAASLAGILLLGAGAYFRVNKTGPGPRGQKISKSTTPHRLFHWNDTKENQSVYLVDGSKVTLRPGASLQHITFLQKDKREVYLDGDAFFEVAKDPSRPFYVYAHDLVLRVLGTSFNVTTNKTNGNITVIVRTGRVSVFKKNNQNKAEFILAPNESIRYSAETQRIVRSMADPGITRADIKPTHPISFNFEETPIKDIFAVLQEAYGIQINFDQKVFSKCIVTAPLGSEPFDEKMNIICEAVGAHYRIDNGQVYVEGTSCK